MAPEEGVAAAEAVLALLEQGLPGLGLSLAPDRCQALVQYFSELRKWSRGMNLVSRQAEPQEILEKHFLDSLGLLLLLDRQPVPQPGRLLDVGSGAGFPGLVLAAARPDLEVTLLEPRLKRVSFLKHIVRSVGLSSVQILAERVEAIRMPLPPFDYITCRAVAEPVRFLSMIEHLLSPVTGVILMLGSEGLRTLPATRDGCKLETVDEVRYSLPFSGDGRQLVLLRRGQDVMGC